jgi:hypothetical protein
MNLNALDTNLGKILNSYARKFQLPSASVLTSQKLTKAIVLCEGTPDNLAIALAAHRVNGTETSAITKPVNKLYTKTNTAAFEVMSLYIRENRSLKGLLFILDQENYSLNSISHEFEKQLNKTVNKYECFKAELEERLKVYHCTYGERKLVLILVINGHPEIITHKHMIEDHFLKVGSKLGIIKFPEKIEDPKEYWEKQTSSQSRDGIVRTLVGNDDLISEFFPQQSRGLEELKSN